MCIRDRGDTDDDAQNNNDAKDPQPDVNPVYVPEALRQRHICLLYTSDAADERSSVDLGGRRIIKKKTLLVTLSCNSMLHTTTL